MIVKYAGIYYHKVLWYFSYNKKYDICGTDYYYSVSIPTCGTLAQRYTSRNANNLI